VDEGLFDLGEETMTISETREERRVAGAPTYDPAALETGWQRRWQEQGLFRAREEAGKPKFYCLDFFPYPSGFSLSVGHCRNYVPTDVVSRYRRMRGDSVLHPMGWDAFGEPAEQFAISQGVHPRITTDRNAAEYRRQLDLIGKSIDWSREIDSSRPEYYHWTQWIFLLLYQRGLAYRSTNWQWWCPTCQTTLSNHEVRDGVCWRGHTGVTKRQIPAWYFKITDYAEPLLAGLSEIDWPESIKAMQENWIGRSEGAEIVFPATAGPLTVYTTRPDTAFGVTFLAIAPEHELVDRLTTTDQREALRAYVEQAKAMGEVDRLSAKREKTGVFTGSNATNALTGETVPIWVADYVLPTYGTGVVMGVPAHDTRDFAFARKYGLPIKVVIAPPGWDGHDLPDAYVGPGEMVRSGALTGAFTPGDWHHLAPAERRDLANAWQLDETELDGRVAAATTDGIAAAIDLVERQGVGARKVQYRMRDWLISRQHYWGAPIPIVHCPVHGAVQVPESELPVELPPMTDFAPDGSGRSPLARVRDWVETTCPVCGGPAERETDTMGGFACSSWYFFRFTSPDYAAGPFDPERLRYWSPTDLYVGGAEHAVMHLLYARFWTQVLHDAGLVPFAEPFPRLRSQGQLLVRTPHRRSTDPNAVEEWVPITPEEAAALPADQVEYRAARMSKSRRNVITPDEMVARYGADSLRLYELFMAPFDQDVEWSDEGINGARRFLGRVWELVARSVAEAKGQRFAAVDAPLARLRHRTVKRVTEDLERLRFNTLVATLMEFGNELGERYRTDRWQTSTFQEAIETFVLLLAPAAPFLAEGLWQLTGGFGRAVATSPFAGEPSAAFGPAGSVHQQSWPTWDEALTREDVATIVVQVNGKLRDRIELPADADEATVRAAALGRPKVQEHVANPASARFVYVPGKLLNVVTKSG
jgi:leucyl-tRNA synthetase